MRRGWSSRARRLLSRDGARVAEAVAYLALARVAVVVLPFRVLARRLGVRHAETPASATDNPGLGGIAWAIGAAARRAPWRSECLEQAIAAKAMLRRRGVASTLYLGMARDPVGAHAWVRVGDVNVTGGRDVARYAVVASFADVDGR
ncbi:MAG TPA: lasso peptide biosynthesis B2 protein [Thermoleophilaceae bacterium]